MTSDQMLKCCDTLAAELLRLRSENNAFRSRVIAECDQRQATQNAALDELADLRQRIEAQKLTQETFVSPELASTVAKVKNGKNGNGKTSLQQVERMDSSGFVAMIHEGGR